MGDLNLVGFKQQLLTLLNGDIQDNATFGEDILPDWDTTSLQDLISYQTDAPTTYTWYDDRSDFAPGRLDYMIYSNSQMQVQKAFTLETAYMSSERLTKYNLSVTDSRIADHLPKVADFTIGKKISSDIKERIETGEFNIYPNPISNLLYITSSENTFTGEIMLVHVNGQIVLNSQIQAGVNTISTENLPAGLYILRILHKSGNRNYKLLKIN